MKPRKLFTITSIIFGLRSNRNLLMYGCALLFFSSVQGQQRRSFTFLNYNTRYGFEKDSALTANYVDWVKKLAPDVIAYQEMNGFTQNDIGDLAKRYGHPYAVIMNREYGVPVTHPLAITSKYPILDVRRVMDNLWHGYLYSKINGIHFFITHLAPFTLEDRQKDIRKIVAQIQSIPKNEMVVLAGDFNALSPMDSLSYGDDLLSAMKRSEGKFIKKSGTPILRNRIVHRRNLNNGQIDYSVIQKLIDAGFEDSFYLRNDAFKNSVPTEKYRKESSFLRRIDYIWVNRQLSKKVEYSDILKDSLTDRLSDHYPTILKLKL